MARASGPRRRPAPPHVQAKVRRVKASQPPRPPSHPQRGAGKKGR